MSGRVEGGGEPAVASIPSPRRLNYLFFQWNLSYANVLTQKIPLSSLSPAPSSPTSTSSHTHTSSAEIHRVMLLICLRKKSLV